VEKLKQSHPNPPGMRTSIGNNSIALPRRRTYRCATEVLRIEVNVTDRIEKTVELAAPIARVWRALTNHEEFGEWFRVRLDGPFTPGQVVRGQITYPGYEHLRWEAVVQKMEPERLFSFTWHPYAVDPNKDYSGEPSTLVEFALEEVPAGTLLRIVESGFDKLPPERQNEAFRMNEGGWRGQVDNITEYLRRTA
jgi:uncharacterized protein YndB with AHSA1/START domain